MFEFILFFSLLLLSSFLVALFRSRSLAFWILYLSFLFIFFLVDKSIGSDYLNNVSLWQDPDPIHLSDYSSYGFAVLSSSVSSNKSFALNIIFIFLPLISLQIALFSKDLKVIPPLNRIIFIMVVSLASFSYLGAYRFNASFFAALLYFTCLSRRQLVKPSANLAEKFFQILILIIIIAVSHSASIILSIFMLLSLVTTIPLNSPYTKKKLTENTPFFAVSNRLQKLTIPLAAKVSFKTALVIVIALAILLLAFSTSLFQEYLPSLRLSRSITNFMNPKILIEILFIILSFMLLASSKMFFFAKSRLYFILAPLILLSIITVGVSLDSSILIGRFSLLFSIYAVFEFIVCQNNRVSLSYYLSYVPKETKASLKVLSALIVLSLFKSILSIYNLLAL